jgi:hydrogenase expression/formation protein HypD
MTQHPDRSPPRSEISSGSNHGVFNPQLFKSAAMVRALRQRIDDLAERIGQPVTLMHICGTHEHEMGRYGLRELLPDTVRVLAGPGCPVCVCDVEYIDTAIRLALMPGVILCSFGDMLGVPGSLPSNDGRRGDVRLSLLDAKARGGDVRVVYSVFDADRIARANPDRQVVFFSVGFETTVVAVAALLKRGAADNFSIIEANYYTPPATALLPTLPGFDVQGFLLPGHASAITGFHLYEHLPRLGVACAVAGFEPVDQLAAIASLLEQIASGRPRLENTYARIVRFDGNPKAKAELESVFTLGVKRWRGIADVPDSGYWLRPEYCEFSALIRFRTHLESTRAKTKAAEHPKGCRCAQVTLGQLEPTACPVFGSRCTPDNPYGPCMVSHEGTCRAWFLYGTGRERIQVEV